MSALKVERSVDQKTAEDGNGSPAGLPDADWIAVKLPFARRTGRWRSGMRRGEAKTPALDKPCGFDQCQRIAGQSGCKAAERVVSH